MIKKKYANQARLRRHRRVRKKVSGSGARPRLSVFRSSTHIYAQIVDDERQTTLVSASSRDPELAKLAPASSRAAASAPAARAERTAAAAKTEAPAEPKRKGGKSGAPAPAAAEAAHDGGEPKDALAGIENNRRVVQARQVGRLIAERAKAAGITKVVFDRGGYIYHGRVAALATGAREGGLDF